MGFQISQIKNQYLKDIATIVDSNNDGIISNGQETSIFLDKSKLIQDNKLCTEEEYGDILTYCPREISTRGGKIQTGTQEALINEDKRKEYLDDFNKQVDMILKEKNLEKNSENIQKAIEIIKTRKEIAIQIKIQESKIEKLKQQKPDEKFEKRKQAITYVSMATGGIAGAFTGAKIGAFGGPVGIATGAFIGGIIGALGAGIAGLGIVKVTLSDEEIAEAIKEKQANIETEQAKLNQLKENYEKI